MGKTAKKTNELKTEKIVPDETAAVTPVTRKKSAPTGALKLTVDINTKGNHRDFIAWRLDQLPKQYGGTVTRTTTGFNASVLFDMTEDIQGPTFFVSRYMASLVAEIRTLDESNLKIEIVHPTGDTVG